MRPKRTDGTGETARTDVSPSPARYGPRPGGDLTGWRQRRLLRVGFDAELAVAVAGDCAIDLHALIELVERGCPPHLAARILAPLDGEEDPC